MAAKQRLSSYAESLSSKAKVRYQEKISVVNGVDPFCGCVGEPVEDFHQSTQATLCRIWFCRLISSPRSSLKSLEAYNQFVCGWIKDVRTWRVAGKYVTTGRVHSFS